MLAVHGHPFLRVKARREPEHELEDEDQGGMKFERLVRGRSMQIDRRGKDGDLSDKRGKKKGDDERPDHGASASQAPIGLHFER
jgi:hypothetical protein